MLKYNQVRTMNKKSKIIIIEDQIILTDSLKQTLSNKYDVVATSLSAKDMLKLCEEYKPDLILTDICTQENSNGITNGKKIKDRYKNKIKVLAMTGIQEITFLEKAKEANLDGFIYKNIDTNTLITTIEQVLNGYKLFPDNIKQKKEHQKLKKLTKKELEILTLLCNGTEREEIANLLNITTGTLKNHISAILNKMEFESISKLLIFCISKGYIVPNQKD